MSNEFDAFLSSPEHYVQVAAQRLKELTDAYQSHQMSQSEYHELANDILDFQIIANQMTDLARKQAIQKTFEQLSAIVGTILSL